MVRVDGLIDGLDFGEAPRWHDGRLWFSDFYQRRVSAVDDVGTGETILELDDQPSGLGWLPDGSLLVVSMTKRQVLRYDGNTTSLHADLSDIAAFDCNDMVVDSRGHAYVGNHGFDVVTLGPAGLQPAKLAHVTPDGRASVAADGLLFPNGSVITPDGSTLIVGESIGRRYTAFDINEDGSLTGQRTWAALDEFSPDGCTLDVGGGIWFADPLNLRVVRVEQGGEITDTMEVDTPVWACALGGADGTTLFMLSSPDFRPEAVEGKGLGSILTSTVALPHAGLP